jgi:hypothetical protein
MNTVIMRLALTNSLMVLLLVGSAYCAGTTKTETFEKDPGWIGVNNRSARSHPPATIRQDFGYSKTSHAGGNVGELGGYIMPAGEIAFYGKKIDPTRLDRPLTASGTLFLEPGETHLLLGFFHADTVNEWRTPNTITMRIAGRGDHFFAFVEYCTSKWRAGGDSTPFPAITDPETGRWELLGYPSGRRVFAWSLAYDPQGNDGKGVVTATINGDTAISTLDEGHKLDGATFNRFGILNVMKSADTGTQVYFDNITVQGQSESFDKDPEWDGRNNRRSWQSTLVRPRFDFGFSPTNFARGKSTGELGGQTFRGDCRYVERMASYGDKLGPLTLDKPIHASGKIAMTRGVTDSTTLFGFYHSKESMRVNDSQDDAIPENCLGIHVEGPSSEGFCFYPVYRTQGRQSRISAARRFNHIYPDGKDHHWSLDYDPLGASGKGEITVVFDGDSRTFDLEEGDRSAGTTFDRFGIVTSWIDGNSQNIYWDDITYTVTQ